VHEIAEVLERALLNGREPALGEPFALEVVALFALDAWEYERERARRPDPAFRIGVSGYRAPTATTKEDTMPAVTTPEQLFVHELQDMYYAEKALTKTLPKLADEASDRELSRAFTAHLKETEKHVTNLERVFRQIGEKAEATPCPGIEGIKKEHDDFIAGNDPSAKIVGNFLTGAAARAEHYEIAGYTGLINQARALGELEAVTLLQQNLRQEKEALKKVETISKRLLKESNGHGTSTSRSRAKATAAR
jgi:ferritin-like metal-binding protein YciE